MTDIDTAHVHGMILFTASADPGDDLYFVNIRLE
jgi:hypothetical protein